MEIIKVFISSTYEDLKNHRNLIIENLQKLALKINAMELWFSKPENPLEVCLNNVSSSDIYIGIVAHRYGSVNKETGKSITELEYEEAKKNGLFSLIFIMGNEHSIKPKFVDKGEKYTKLKNFKEKLMSERYLSFFNTPDDLLDKVIISIKELMKEKEIDGIKEFNIDETWKEIKLKWENIDAPLDLKIDCNLEQNMEELIEILRTEIKAVEKFHKNIKTSYSKLDEDLKFLLEKLEINTKRIEEVPYYQNPFINRDWETITFFPNVLKKLKLLVLQVKLTHLYRKAEESIWNKEIEEKIKNTKKEFKVEVENAIYID